MAIYADHPPLIAADEKKSLLNIRPQNSPHFILIPMSMADLHKAFDNTEANNIPRLLGR